MSLLEPPAWPAVCNKQKKLGLRMYQTSRASSNKSVRAQLVSLFLSPLPFPFSSYSTSPLHLPLQIQGLSDLFRASLTNDLSFDTGMVSDNVKRDVMLEIESVLDREVDQA